MPDALEKDVQRLAKVLGERKIDVIYPSLRETKQKRCRRKVKTLIYVE